MNKTVVSFEGNIAACKTTTIYKLTKWLEIQKHKNFRNTISKLSILLMIGTLLYPIDFWLVLITQLIVITIIFVFNVYLYSIVPLYEEIERPLIELFNQNQKKYATVVQFSIIYKRKYQLKFANLKYNGYFLIDRSIIGDYVFALVNTITGSIKEEEFDAYKKICGFDSLNISETNFFNQINIIVFLMTSYINCDKRLQRSERSEKEKLVPLDYQKLIDDVHFNIILKLLEVNQKSILLLDEKQYTNIELVNKLIDEKKYSSENQSPTIKKVTNFELPNDKSIKLFNLSTPTHLIEKGVYIITKEIEQDILTNNVNSENSICIKYGIKFYTEEFKQIFKKHYDIGSTLIFQE